MRHLEVLLSAWGAECGLSKHYEYQADSFAVSAGYGDALCSALKKITAGHEDNFSLTHPTTVWRVRKITGPDLAEVGKVGLELAHRVLHVLGV